MSPKRIGFQHQCRVVEAPPAVDQRWGIGMLRLVRAVLAIAVGLLLGLPAISLADDCVNISTGEPAGCDEPGAVTQEIYDGSRSKQLNEMESAEESSSSSSSSDSSSSEEEIIAGVAAGAVVVFAVGAFVLFRRRQRGKATAETVASAKPAMATPTTASTAPAPLATPAGWYADPEMVDTQRYWDGKEWTQQRAPMSSDGPASRPTSHPKSSGMSFSALLALAGGAAAIVGTFLPWVEQPGLIPIRDNTLIQGGSGWIVVALVLGALASAWSQREKLGRSPALMVTGGLIIAYAIYAGTGDRLDLTFGGKMIAGTPGIGVYVVGAGGLAMLAAGWRED